MKIIIAVIIIVIIFAAGIYFFRKNKAEEFCGKNCPTLKQNLGYCIRRNAFRDAYSGPSYQNLLF